MFRLRFGLAHFLVCALLCPVLAQTPQPPQQKPPLQGEVLRIGAEEVLLDIVVRDKKGRGIRDLKAGDIEIYEDGVKQEITSFRLVNREAVVEAGSNSTTPANAPKTNVPSTADPTRQINLVSFVFERLSPDGRRNARMAAMEFLKEEYGPNVMVAIFALDQRLSAIQSFTSDRDRIKTAVDRVIGMAPSSFASESQKIRQELENFTKADATAAQSAASVGQGGASTVNGGAFADAKAAEVTLNILRLADDSARQQQGQASIFSLLSLIEGQKKLLGRKTVVYFSEGLQVPPNLKDAFQTTISSANRANVSFYAMDARGLQTQSDFDSAKESLNSAVAATQRQQRTRGGEAVTVEQVKAFDNAESAITKNTQNNLASLAESTGGAFVANTNDFRTPMKRVLAELNSYYEASYSPTGKEFDGKFRTITVKALRPDIVLQTRSGYFAVPTMEGVAQLLPYELPMLAALSAKPLPRDFDIRQQILHFADRPNGTQEMLVLEVPLANLTFKVDETTKLYSTHCSLLALLKNSEGRVVHKFSEDFPLDGPTTRLEALKKGNLVFTRAFDVPPGRYTLETVAHDRETNKKAVRRSILLVPNRGENLKMSSVSIIKRIDPIDQSSASDDNPFRFQTGKIIPNLGEPIKPVAGSELGIYTVIYPLRGSTDKPQLILEVLLDGQSVARGQLELPAPDAQGRIPYIARVPLENFKTAGNYEIRVITKQGAQAVEEHAFFIIGS
ncbi:MAG: VWA domain-containing protein [Acidobacteria bacterium]|nr:VWA domain-containing protein [Acidobacteriota bacterium]